MTQIIIDGVCERLYELFPGVKIYTEHVEQGFEIPSFFVQCIDPENRRYRDTRWHGSALVTVQYFAADADRNAEMNNIADELFTGLEVIETAEGPVRGILQATHIEDGVLTYPVMYRYFQHRPEDYELMETMDLNQEVKDGN